MSATVLQKLIVVKTQRYLGYHVLFLPAVPSGDFGPSIFHASLLTASKRQTFRCLSLTVKANLPSSGTTSDFCSTADLCQNNCFEPTEPSCSSNDVLKKVIGYYESWSPDRACDGWAPSDISANGLTHLFFSFALFEEVDSEWQLYVPAGSQDDMVTVLRNFIALKDKNTGLSTVLSVGG